jgi:2-oxoisovalerate dehydrogenase E1 component
VIRTASLDSPVPFNLDLEQNFLPKERFKTDLDNLVNF